MQRWSAQNFLNSLSTDEAALYRGLFLLRAHDYQLEPDGDWTTWLLLGGRGSGKTRAGAEWVLEKIAFGEARRVALIGETLADVADVMIEGPSGLRNAAMQRDERPRFLRSQGKVTWTNGAVAHVFSAEDPDALRGHAFDLAWGDEFCKWRHAQETFDTLQMALREGGRPRQLFTTTPKNRPELRMLLTDPDIAVTRATSFDNAANLSPAFFKSVVKRYEGTRLGRQELMGEVLADLEGALWNRQTIERARVRTAPELTRIVVAVDPAVSAGRAADACGIVAAGRAADGRAYVLADKTVHGASPAGWAGSAIALYHALKADCVVAEANQGGELIRTLFRETDASVPVRLVHATRAKRARAEPAALLYEQGRVAHVGAFPELEDQMCAFGAEDVRRRGRGSPDRVDALVWAVWELMLRRDGEARVRAV